MIIAGLQKTTLIDYPGKIACVVFLAGCNFRCPWCYSAELVLPEKILKQHWKTQLENQFPKNKVPDYSIIINELKHFLTDSFEN